MFLFPTCFIRSLKALSSLATTIVMAMKTEDSPTAPLSQSATPTQTYAAPQWATTRMSSFHSISLTHHNYIHRNTYRPSSSTTITVISNLILQPFLNHMSIQDHSNHRVPTLSSLYIPLSTGSVCALPICTSTSTTPTCCGSKTAGCPSATIFGQWHGHG